MAPRFEDRAAVVTGAGQGIGREIALAFAAAGAKVVLAARSRERIEAVAAEVDAAGGAALAVPTDVGEEGSVEALRDAALAWSGSVDVLVGNAGIAGPTAVLWEQSPEDWRDVFRVNVAGAFLCCRAFMPALIASRGNVVLIGSRTGKGVLYGRTPYAASKLALVGMARTLAVESGPHGVRVNLISPGAVEGERLDRVIRAQADARGRDPEEVREAIVAEAPLKRFVSPRDVAATVLFLASERAASITGEDVNVTAGHNSF